MNKFYVYEWFITKTKEVFYVGKGCGNRYKNIYRRNKFFKDILKTHECEVRKVYINLTEKEAFLKEIELIKFYKENTNYRLTNQTDGGEGASGWKAPKEFKIKQSYLSRNRWQDKEFKDKMMKIRQGDGSPYKTKEFRMKISRLVKGENNPNYKNYWSNEKKESLSIKQKNNSLYKNENNPNSQKIICLENGEVFKCIKYAKQKYGVKSETSFSAALKNPIRTAANLHWAKFEEDLLDEKYRKKYLINILKKDTNKSPMICLDNLEIFFTKKELADKLNISVKK